MSVARPKLLVVDDGERHVELAHALLTDYDYATRCELPGPCWTCRHRAGCQLTHAHDWAETEQTLSRHPDVDVVLLDVTFDLPEERLLSHPSDRDDLERRRRLQGLAILARLRRLRASLPVVLMTGREELVLDEAEEALDADEYVTLAGRDSFDARALGLLVERLLARRASVGTGSYEWGRSRAMAKVRQEVLALSRSSLPMLVLGETGTGKTALVEEVVHPRSGRRGPFVSVDLSAIPRELVAAELFGTVRGAFSGAVDRVGRFEQASGGTLLLDEIGNLPPEAQRMLLLALQDRRVTRLGEGRPRPVDVKVVAATNGDLARAVREGAFRADLYARLNPAAQVRLPPLRERMEDLDRLLERFCERAFEAPSDRALLEEHMALLGQRGAARARLAIGSAQTTAPSGVTFVLPRPSHALLRRHAFPGNVRELALLAANACVSALTDSIAAARGGRKPRPDDAIVPLAPRRIRELLEAGWVEPSGDDREAAHVRVGPFESLKDLRHAQERALFERLYDATGGDFEAMAKRLLRGDPSVNARKVQLRFNQLGLRVRGES